MTPTKPARSIVILTALLACAVTLGAQAPDRSTPPAPGPLRPLRLPAIEARTLSNGLPVWIVEEHQVPVVQVNLLVRAGAAADPAGKYGLADMTAALLTDGAGSRSALEVADAIDFLGADLRASSGIDESAIRLHVPVAHLAEALPVMADIVERPTFPDAEIARTKRARLTSILQARDDPSSLAATAFPHLLYGSSHRYGTPDFGTAANVRSFTADDLRTFYEAWYRPANAQLIVVGDVKPETVLPMLEEAFGSWNVRGAAPARPVLDDTQEPARRQIYLVDKPGAAQSEIRIGWIGVARSTPDFFPITVMNTLLGGSFTSRLNQNLREKHGYTYGAGSGFDMRIGAGPFAAGAAVQTDKTADALREFFNEFRGMLTTPPATDVDRAKNYVALRFPGTFQQTSSIARRLEQLIVFSLPQDYYAHYQERIEQVTPADVERVAQKYIQPDRFIIVVVG
ncbi:MAG TPA: pitrilysin family protein, partial [Vicinamibacterales bacterium]|nr:pitrilysin family protein [Vicinamibacterales bacterium]